MEEEVCKVCGKTIPMGRRKYCSYECCRYANKHDLKINMKKNQKLRYIKRSIVLIVKKEWK